MHRMAAVALCDMILQLPGGRWVQFAHDERHEVVESVFAMYCLFHDCCSSRKIVKHSPGTHQTLADRLLGCAQGRRHARRVAPVQVIKHDCLAVVLGEFLDGLVQSLTIAVFAGSLSRRFIRKRFQRFLPPMEVDTFSTCDLHEPRPGTARFPQARNLCHSL